MELIRYGQPGSERPAVLAGPEGDETAYDLSTLTDDITGEFLAGGGIDAVQEALDAGQLPRTTSRAT